MARLLFDIEADGLLPEITKVHCIAGADVDTGARFVFGPQEIPRALEFLATADVLIAHNGLRYDFPALEKLYGFHVDHAKQRDTYIIAQLIHPNLRDTDSALVESGRLPSTFHSKHSLEAWGHRLGVHKASFEGPWAEWSQAMQDYCIQDIETTLALWKRLNPDAYSQDAIELEHRIFRICTMMEEAGWPFDEKAAQVLHVELMGKHGAIEKELVAEFGFWYEPKEKKTKDAKGVVPYFTPKRDDNKRGYVKDCPCTKIEKVTFNPGSRDHIIRCLTRLGWKPQAFTDSGKPRLDDEILEELSERFPQGGKLVEFLLLDKRIGQLATGDKAWLKLVGPDGKMHGAINPMGTTHSRAAHFRPNMGQVPAGKSPYGKECRALFTVPDTHVLVGADQQGLQLRALGHYLTPFDDGAYGRLVTTGDPHWATALALGLVEGPRDPHNDRHEVIREAGSKRFIYAYVFGGMPNMLGSIVRDCCTILRAKGLGDDLFEKFFGEGQSNRDVGEPAKHNFDEKLFLGKLQNKLAYILHHGQKRGSIPGLDGRWVPCRSERVALNYALSSAEAIICKRWVVDAYDALVARGFKWGWDADFVFVAWVHDEIQCAVRKGKEDEVGDILVECARRAGEHYGFRVPLDSKYKVGSNWSQTH